MKKNLFLIMAILFVVGCGNTSIKDTIVTKQFDTTRNQTTQTLFNYAGKIHKKR